MKAKALLGLSLTWIVFGLFFLSVHSRAQPFDSILPWKGIKNDIFEPWPPRYIAFWGGVILSEYRCFAPIDGLIKDLRPVTSGREVQSGVVDAVWQEQLARVYSAGIASVGIVHRVEGRSEKSVSASKKRKRLKNSAKIESGSTLETSGSLDLFLGDNGPVVRLLENTEAEFVRLHLHLTGSEKIINTMIDLRRGRVQGTVKKLAAASNYMVRTGGGVIRISGTEYEIHADGTCAIITGSAEVYTDTHVYTVNAGEIYRPNSPKWGSELRQVLECGRLATAFPRGINQS